MTVVGWSCPLASVSACRRPSTSFSLYGSTLMKVTPGYFVTKGLIRSRVGPHCAVVQNLGVAKITTNGTCFASAWSTDVL